MGNMDKWSLKKQLKNKNSSTYRNDAVFFGGRRNFCADGQIIQKNYLAYGAYFEA